MQLNDSIKETKTGALICKKRDAEKEFVYEALLFIENIPHDFSNDDLEKKLNASLIPLDISECNEILFRADVHATSNEVQEQFEGLHKNEKQIPRVQYQSLAQL